MALYFWYADAFSFPPDVVDRLTPVQDYWFRVMKQARDAAREILEDEQAREFERMS